MDKALGLDVPLVVHLCNLTRNGVIAVVYGLETVQPLGLLHQPLDPAIYIITVPSGRGIGVCGTAPGDIAVKKGLAIALRWKTAQLELVIQALIGHIVQGKVLLLAVGIVKSVLLIGRGQQRVTEPPVVIGIGHIGVGFGIKVRTVIDTALNGTPQSVIIGVGKLLVGLLLAVP